MAVEVFPDLGTNVEVTLVSGGKLTGYWDGVQWWCGVDGQESDVPVVNSFVASWAPLG